jgi:homeobox protein cut-like
MEVGNLRQTLASYNLEFAEIKNQGNRNLHISYLFFIEVTIRQLREKIKSYETEMENAIQTKLTEQENELKNRFDERERQMIESESMLTIRADEADRRADNLQKSLTSAQQELFELRLRIDRSQDARSDQFDMIAADLERANQRAEAAEREVTLLMKRVEKDKDARKSESDNDQHIRDQMATLEAEISAKDKQVS